MKAADVSDDTEFLITPEQLKQGWLELKGVVAEHRSYIVLRRLESGNYVVRAPRLRPEPGNG